MWKSGLLGVVLYRTVNVGRSGDLSLIFSCRDADFSNFVDDATDGIVPLS